MIALLVATVAALLAGAGGLLVQMVCVRSHGLLFGMTAETTMLVLAGFLVGLGVGGVVGPRIRWLSIAPARGAAVAYAVVAASVAMTVPWLRTLPPQSAGLGHLWLLAAPVVPAIAMGAAFPLLLAAAGARAVPWIVGVNLLGSVPAAFFGGLVLVPTLGLSLCAWLCVGAYALAAVLVLGMRRESGNASGNVDRGAISVRDAVVAAGSGFVLLGHETLLLRRLPFFVEGFQPALAGIVATCLAAMALGAAGLAPLLVRLAGRNAGALAVLLAGVGIAVGAHEWAAPAIALQPVDSDAAMHGRILWTSVVAGAASFCAIGAVIPALLAGRTATARASGLLYMWQGIGTLLAAIVALHLLPRIWPADYFVALPLALVVVAAGVAATSRRIAIPALVAAASAAFVWPTWLGPEHPIRGARWDRPWYVPRAHATDAITTASYVYDRQNHSRILFTDEFRAAETGPHTGYMRVLAHLPMLLRPNARRAAVLMLGTGTTAASALLWPGLTDVDVVELSPAVTGLAKQFAAPLPSPLDDPRVAVHVTDARRHLAHAAPASFDIVSMEPLLPYAPATSALYSAEFYELARRTLAPDGLLVQWVPTHALPADAYATLLATFARAFPHASAWLVDQSTLLVGSTTPHVPTDAALDAAFAALPDEVRAELHDAGIALPIDVRLAYVGDGLRDVFAEATTLVDDRPFLEHIGFWDRATRLAFQPTNVARLVELARRDGDAFAAQRVGRLNGLVDLAAAADDASGARIVAAVRAFATVRSVAPESVLLHREETTALRFLTEREIYRHRFANGARLAAAHLRREPGTALLQACLGLPSERGTPSIEPADAAMRAYALDPTFLWSPLPLPPGIPIRDPGAGLLEDAADPIGRSVADVVGPSIGLARRKAWPVRSARVLIDALAKAPLSADAVAALREVLDPHLLTLAAAAIVARDGDLAREIRPLWRHDLPMPASIAALRTAPIEQRIDLADLVAGRRDPRARDLLAQLLLDDDVAVRTAAGVALYRTVGDDIRYDPEGAAEDRARAAARLRGDG